MHFISPGQLKGCRSILTLDQTSPVQSDSPYLDLDLYLYL